MEFGKRLRRLSGISICESSSESWHLSIPGITLSVSRKKSILIVQGTKKENGESRSLRHGHNFIENVMEIMIAATEQ